ncbi:MAG: FHA domain-containing protein [Xanthomonadales bacterium]|nr:FHA domain-containing protein [Xanthomonadales bacterium]
MNDQSLDSARPLGSLEILNRNGQVLHRQVWNGSLVCIGRAHDNELVVVDPYVSPHHLQLSLQDGQPQAQDLDSLNGSYLGSSKSRQSLFPLGDGQTIHFGHSQLRFHSCSAEVAPTLRDTARLGMLSMLGSPWVLIGAAILALLALYASELLEDPGKLTSLGIAEEMSYPLIGITAWAGFWALMNRVLAHRFHFLAHLAIAFAGVAVLFAVAQLITLLGFALGLDNWVWWLRWLARISILGLVVFAHSHYFSQASPRRQALLAGIVALVLFGTPAVGSFIEKTQFSSLPWLDPLLLPPAYQWREGDSMEVFMQRAQSLRADADAGVDGGERD